MSGQPSLSKSAATTVRPIAAVAVGDAGCRGDVRERSVAVVAVERMAARRQPARPAVHRNAFPVAVGVSPGFGSVLESKSGNWRRTDRDARRGHSRETCSRTQIGPCPGEGRPCGDIGERAVAIVAIQNVLAPVGDEQIVESVVVVVANSDARRPAGAEQAGLLRHVGERAVAVVLVQAVGRAPAARPSKREPDSTKMSSQPSLS